MLFQIVYPVQSQQWKPPVVLLPLRDKRTCVNHFRAAETETFQAKQVNIVADDTVSLRHQVINRPAN